MASPVAPTTPKIMLVSGYANQLSARTRYEYRTTIEKRMPSSVKMLLEIRVRPDMQVTSGIEHGTKVYGGGIGYYNIEQTWEGMASMTWGYAFDYKLKWHFGAEYVENKGVYRRVYLKKNGEVWEADKWTDWVTAFDATVPIGINEKTLYVFPNMGVSPFTFNEDMGPLSGGFNVGVYPKPADVSDASYSPSSINVAFQNSINCTVKWRGVTNVGYYRLYVNKQKNMTGIKLVRQFLGTELTFNPKQAYVGGVSWEDYELVDGDELWFGIQPYGETGIPSDEIKWVGPIRYYENKCYAPTAGFMVDGNDYRNQLPVMGQEKARVYYGGQSNGSYSIASYTLRREDGKEVSWTVDDEQEDSIGTYVEVDLGGWDEDNDYVQFELRAYNTMGHPVYMRSGKWLKFSAKYYSGFTYVYGKDEYYGDDDAYGENDSEEEWRYGLCYVYDGGAWRRASEIHVYDGKSWR